MQAEHLNATCLPPDGETQEPRPQTEPLSIEASRHALDELFDSARLYRTSDAYKSLIEFVGRFRFYSPYNAMLTHIQMPGAKYVAPAGRWLEKFGRYIRAGARPIVILQPMGPVMFVFDVGDTEPLNGAPPLPPEVTQPFETKAAKIGNRLARTIENAKRDGIKIIEREAGSQSAGAIQPSMPGKYIELVTNFKLNPASVLVPLRYQIFLNSRHSDEAKYATLAHELGHLYCGHLGTPHPKWWPDRRGMDRNTCEFEAESVCYLICERLGIVNPSAEYLGEYLKDIEEIPTISLDTVMKAIGLIEQMGRERLKLRKEP